MQVFFGSTSLIDRLITPISSRGRWGSRDIPKKFLALPVLQFNAANDFHVQLPELGGGYTEKVASWLKSG